MRSGTGENGGIDHPGGGVLPALCQDIRDILKGAPIGRTFAGSLKEIDNEYKHKLIGMIGIRTELEHICFFFVGGQYHRKGIGTKMFDYLLENYKGNNITVNSSPYGLGFYKKLGFVPTEEEKTINGIRFTPMIYERKSNGSDL